jgi:hypothetical protein
MQSRELAPNPMGPERADNQLELPHHPQDNFGLSPTRPLLFSSEMNIEPRNLDWRVRRMILPVACPHLSRSSHGKSDQALNRKASGFTTGDSASYHNARYSTSSIFTARKQWLRPH